MDTRHLAVGNRIKHPQHGWATVSYVGTDRIGLTLEDGQQTLIRRDMLEKEAPEPKTPVTPQHRTLSWPDSTFVHEAADAGHFMGSHWDPFVEDIQDILLKLPDMLPTALLQTGHGDRHPSPRVQPQDWPPGFTMVWPLHTHGLALVLRPEEKGNNLVSLFPFFASDRQQRMTLREVCVWEGGLEAQITALWGESEVSFFDTHYPLHRAWYERDRAYDVVLTGIAYSAAPAQKREWAMQRDPDELAWMNQHLRSEGDAPFEATYTLNLDEAAIFLPVEQWDVDDYSFHAPVKTVEAFKDWLGQDGWRVRATVMRFGPEDADLDIVITRRAWSGQNPPQVGQTIEGRLWLQGYLDSLP